MTQRNPMNERYQEQDDQKLGKTRKSAASAKPKTKAGSSVYVSGSDSGKPKSRMARARSQATKETTSGKTSRTESPKSKAEYYNPGTPEYKKWRRVYWVTLVAALVFTALSFAVMQFWPDNTALSFTMLGLAYAGLVAGILVDVIKVRKIRKQYREKMVSANSKKARAEEKAKRAEQKRLEEQAALEEEKKASEKQAKKQSIKDRFGFGKKVSSGSSDGDAKDASPDAADAKTASPDAAGAQDGNVKDTAR